MFVLARSDGYDQGTPSGERVAPALVRQAAPQGGPAERPPHRAQPHALPVAPVRARHSRRPWLPSVGCTAQALPCAPGAPGGRAREEQRPKRCTVPRGGPLGCPRCPSWPWPRHRG
jgi:hypothetical protein